MREAILWMIIAHRGRVPVWQKQGKWVKHALNSNMEERNKRWSSKKNNVTYLGSSKDAEWKLPSAIGPYVIEEADEHGRNK